MDGTLAKAASMRAYIANFGRENQLWPKCRTRPSVATLEDSDLRPLRVAGDRDAYIERCVQTRRTASGRTLPRQVASRWFNLSHIVSSTEDDLWLHREKDELWWTFSRAGEVEVSLERTPDGTADVYELHKRTDSWSNTSKVGVRLNWNGLHPKAKPFLFTEGTLQELSDDHAAYALALINGSSLERWHSRSEWKEKADAAGRGAVTMFDARRRAIIDMARSAFRTAAYSNGQQVSRTVKDKDVLFPSEQHLTDYIDEILAGQGGACAITRIQLQYYGEHDDEELLCSLDRIDSDRHYEEGNLQVVCRFVNRWKSNAKDGDFRRLIALVQSLGSDAGSRG